jgi:hypothetical protein
MTRRKDTIRVRNQSKKTIYQKRNSRLEKQKQQEEGYQEEKRQEKHLLSIVEVLPDELIRLIYDYLTGEAKLNFNPKYERLRVGFYFPLQLDLLTFFKKMSNAQILDLIYTGTLQKYPEIIGNLSYAYYYSIIDHDFHTVKGYHLLQLWSSRRLSYDFIRGVYDEGSEKSDLDLNIRDKLSMAIRNYIMNAFYSFRNCKNKRTDALDDKNKLQYQNYRNLFVGMEKAYYLYKVVMRFIDKPEPELELDKKVVEAPYDPFSNELLIPTPLHINM